MDYILYRKEIERLYIQHQKLLPQSWNFYDFPSALVYRFFSLSCNICSGFPLEHVLAFKFMIHIVNLLTAHSIWNLYLTF